jgi:hypothetical protein
MKGGGGEGGWDRRIGWGKSIGFYSIT